ncbi:MAG: IS3 family transposase [Clostridia bacterium]|nr:IS3 family transposase [Clostridia bacterium]
MLKSELLYLQTFDSIEYFKTELIDYLHYYTFRRIKAKLMGLSPAIHRQQALLLHSFSCLTIWGHSTFRRNQFPALYSQIVFPTCSLFASFRFQNKHFPNLQWLKD